MSSWVIDSWVSGLGRQQVNLATASDLTSIWDVENLDTRIDGQIILSPAFNTATIVPSRGDLDIAFEYLGQLYFAESKHATGVVGATIALSPATVYQLSPPFNLGSYRNLALTFGSSSFGVEGEGSQYACGSLSGLLPMGDRLIFLHTFHRDGNNRTHLSTVSTLGGLFTPLGTMQTFVSEDFQRLSQFAALGGTAHFLTFDSVKKKMGFWVADDKAALTSIATIAAQVGSYIPPLVTNGVTMFAQLPQGIYDFDLTPDIVVDTSRSQDKNGAQVMFQGNLYFKNKQSLIKYDGANVEGVGYNLRDGLPSDKNGEITAMVSSWERTFAAVYGATYSHILTRDANNAWQYYARIPTAGLWVRQLFLSDAPDAIDRLWCIFGNHPFPGYFLNPMVNPLQAATYSYVPTGYFTPPIYGGDLPEENGAFYDMAVSGDAIAGGNKMLTFFELEKVVPFGSSTSLGQISSLTQTLKFGSPFGLEGFRIQPQIMLAASASGTTPVLRQAIVHYLKKPNQREIFDMEIDIEETAKAPMRSAEAILGSLSSESNSRVMMPFWYGQIATRHVLVISEPSNEDIPEGKIFEGERTGFIRLQVAEIV